MMKNNIIKNDITKNKISAVKIALLTIALLMMVLLAGCTKKDSKAAAAQTIAATTEAATEAATEAVTEAATEAVTEAATEAVTEAATEAVTEAATEAATEAVTEAATEAAVEAVTEATTEAATETAERSTQSRIDESKYYYDVENVALYIHTYGRLPDNYITKKKAKALGWEGGSVETVKPDAAIGGDHFGNFEGKLPEKDGREYTECDIDTHGYKNRGSRRLIFSNDGLYFYTSDHYETFDELYITDDGRVEWR